MQNTQAITMAYIDCRQNYLLWKEFYRENTKPNLMKIADSLCGFCKSEEWELMLTSNFVFAGKNYCEPLIDGAHIATAHREVQKTMQYRTDRYQSQSLSALVPSFVVTCNACQWVKQSNKPLLDLVTLRHVPVRPWTDMSMHFLKLTPVFI